MTTTKKTSKEVEKKTSIKKIEEIQAEKHAKEEEMQEKSIENGTGILIMLSGDILMGWLLFKKGITYKINKQQFIDLEKHTRILGVAMQIL